MRLLMVTPRFLPDTGGVETHVYEVSRRLAPHGVDVTVLCTDIKGSMAARGSIGGIPVIRVPAHPRSRDYRFSPGLGAVIAGERWDLIHVQSYHTLVAPHAMASALRRRVPYVLSFHAGGHSDRLRAAIRPLQQYALRPLIARAARLVVMSQFEIEVYAKRLGLPRSRFVPIPNGADLPDIPAHERLDPDPDLIASVGRLERYKGHQRVIAAMPDVLRRRPGARLWIAGSGPYEPELRRLADSLGVGDRVDIRSIPPDQRLQMAKEISRAGLVVLLSEFETHPIAALEAAALGRRLLVADTTGLSQLAEQGIARAIPLDAAPAAVAASIVQEMDGEPVADPPVLASWHDCAENLADVYRSVLAGAPR